MDSTFNQFRCLRLRSTPPLGPKEGSDYTYSWINLLNTEEDDDTLDELPDDANPITDDEDNMKIEMSLNVKNYRLFKAKSAQTLSWGKLMLPSPKMHLQLWKPRTWMPKP